MKFLTVNEVAEIVRANPKTVRDAIHDGSLEAGMIGARWLIREEAVQAWFDKRAASSGSSAPRRAGAFAREPRRTPSRTGSVAQLRAIQRSLNAP